MSNEFKPGHPVVFVLAIAAMTFLIYSLGLAWMNQNDCDDVAGGSKHWVVFPPGWECGGSGIELTSDG